MAAGVMAAGVMAAGSMAGSMAGSPAGSPVGALPRVAARLSQVGLPLVRDSSPQTRSQATGARTAR